MAVKVDGQIMEFNGTNSLEVKQILVLHLRGILALQMSERER